MKKLILIVLLLFAIDLYSQKNTNIISFMQDPNSQPVDMKVDIDNISANIKIDPYKQLVEGRAIIKFKTLRASTDSIVFTTPEMNFNSAIINGKSIEYRKAGDLTTLYFPKNMLDYYKDYELIIDYTALPTTDLFFSGWNDKTGRKKKQIWAHSPSHWLPFINQKQDILKTELYVTFDNKYKVFSNGKRVSVTDNYDGTNTWHYKLDAPHVIYLVCLVIGDYDWIDTKSNSGLPIELWYYPEQKDRVATTYLYMEKMVDFLENEIGVKYPWGSYRQAPVIDYLYGAMETTSATVFGDYMFVDPRAWWMRNYVNVNAHELTHQWFGNLVSHLPPYVWLTESFATYYAKIFEKSVFGDDYYQLERDKELTRVLNAAKSNSIPVASSLAGSDRWYPKGSLIIDMLRDMIGDKEFRTAIKYYMEQNYHKVASTADFVKAFRESTGWAIDWFIELWIERGGEPNFEVSYDLFNKDNKNYVQVKINQTHKTDELIKIFKVPINIDIYFKDKSKITYSNWINDKVSIFDIQLPQNKEFDFLIFDPNRKIIKTLEFDRTIEELSSQAINSENMIDRYDALLALRKFDISDKRDLLAKVYHKETFHLTKGEAIYQLINDKESYNLIKEAINSHDEEVIKVIVDNIKQVPLELEKDYKIILKDSSYYNVAMALENLSYSFPENDYLSETKDEIGWRGKNIRIKWLELALNKNKNQQKLLDELIDYSSHSFEFETRINAINALKNLNYADTIVLNNIIDAYNYWNNKLRPVALDALKYYYTQNQYRELIKQIAIDTKNTKILDILK